MIGVKTICRAGYIEERENRNSKENSLSIELKGVSILRNEIGLGFIVSWIQGQF